MSKNPIDPNTFQTDEEIITIYRDADSKNQREIFNYFLARPREEKSSWKDVMKKYIRWRLKRSKGAFDIYDESDLYQRCLCCFFKAMSEKYQFDRDTKFSTYMYSALGKTVNRVLVELRKKKRTICIDGRRISPRKFTKSLNQPVKDDDSLSLSELIPDKDIDTDLTDDEIMLVESILMKCKKYLTPMQYEIFIKGDIQCVVSGKDLAEKFHKSEPTISAIKKRKIGKVLRQIKQEVIQEHNLCN